MPKIPDASQLGGRPQLSPRSVITTPDNSSLFRAAENRGKVISGIGSMMSDEIIKRNKQKEDDQNKLQMAIAESNLLKKQLDFESSLEGNDDYTNYEKNFNEFSAAAKSEIIQGITDPKARELFSVNVDNNFARQQARVKEMAFKKQGEYSISAVNQTIENNKSLYAATKDPSYRQRLLESSVAAIDRLRPFVGPVDRDKSRRVAAEGFAEITLMEMSPKDRIAALSSKTTKVSGQAPKDRDEAIKFLIDRFEGESFVASDGKRGASKFGINAQANGLTNEQVESLTREDAESIYRTDYWKKINADSLPENIRFLAFDTAVNFGQPQAKEWLAKSGNDPEKLLELREKTHKELAEKEPEVYGKYQKSWGNRNETVRRLTIGEERTGTIVDALPFDKRIKMVEQAQEDIKSEKKLREQAIKESREKDIETKINNEINFMDSINSPESSYQQKLVALNKLDLEGAVTNKFASEARQYLNSTEKLAKVSDPLEEADIIQRVYDVSAFAEDKPKDFLNGVSNIKRDIMKKRAEGKLSANSEAKLNRQIQTITSAKNAGAAKALSYSFGDARKVIESNLSPEYRLSAMRDLNEYASQIEQTEQYKKNDKGAMKALYKSKAIEITDTYKKEGRVRAVERIGKITSGQPITKIENPPEKNGKQAKAVRDAKGNKAWLFDDGTFVER